MTPQQNRTEIDLREQLEHLTQELRSQAYPDILATLRQTNEELLHSGIVERSLHVGEKAPDFTLPDATGQSVRLAHCLAKGPVVVTFYRGAW